MSGTPQSARRPAADRPAREPHAISQAGELRDRDHEVRPIASQSAPHAPNAGAASLLDAALSLAKRWDVFPAPPGTKKGYISKTDKRSNGRNWGKTRDPELIIWYWKQFPNANVAIPTGPENGFWVLETDTAAGHGVDGEAELNKVEARYGKLPDTLMAISPSGSKHRYFKYPPTGKVFNRAAALGPRGIDVRGDGGMVIAPPSRRKDGMYRWLNDLPIAEGPQWLIELVTAPKIKPSSNKSVIRVARAKKSGQPHAVAARTDFNQADALQVLNDACEELAAEPEGARNDLLSYLAFFLGQLVGGGRLDEGVVWARLTQAARDCGLAASETAATIESGVSAGKLRPRVLVAEAWRQHIENEALPPQLSIAVGRRQVQRTIARFLDNTALDRVEAMRATTGSGKTRIAIELLAKWLNSEASRTLLYLTPRLDLCEDIAKQFAERGIYAKVYRGREADDPEQPEQRMCVNLKPVRIAVAAGLSVEKSCCHYERADGSEAFCPFYDECGFQKQFDDNPRVWVAARNLLFFEQRKLFGGDRPSLIVIDEAFWDAGLSGFVIPVTDLFWRTQHHQHTADAKRRWQLAEKLERLLKLHSRQLSTANRIVALRLSAFRTIKLSIEDCQDAIALEHKYMHRAKLYPGIPEHWLQNENDTISYGDKISIEDVGPERKIIAIWRELANIIEQEINVSGRLRLVWEKIGERRVHIERETRYGTERRMELVRGKPADYAAFVHLDTLDPVHKQWRRAPTFLMDATLPGIEILQRLFPQVKVVADINIRAPHATIRQVVRAPVSAAKLKHEHNREAVLRYILWRWFECGCNKTLIVAQKAYADWLRADRLPENIHVRHYNAIAGDDSFGDVRLAICIGRTEPTPLAIETLAGAISGAAPESVIGPGDWWYQQVDYEIAPGVVVKVDRHVDKLGEPLRQQVCEAGIVQAIGRARAINRIASNPVDTDILADVFLPLQLDKAMQWQTPSAVVFMLSWGFVLASPRDMTRVWPQVWANERAAKRALAALWAPGAMQGTQGHPPIEERGGPLYRQMSLCSLANGIGLRPIHYQHAGRYEKWRPGWYDPTVVPDPKAFLEDRLGCKVNVRLAA